VASKKYVVLELMYGGGRKSSVNVYVVLPEKSCVEMGRKVAWMSI
jgi:hypothetical protein